MFAMGYNNYKVTGARSIHSPQFEFLLKNSEILNHKKVESSIDQIAKKLAEQLLKNSCLNKWKIFFVESSRPDVCEFPLVFRNFNKKFVTHHPLYPNVEVTQLEITS